MGRGDINAIQRIIEACEHSKGAAVEVINHLLGATKHHEFVGDFVTDLAVSPVLVAKLLRAARGERVELGRLSFGASGEPSSVAESGMAMLRKAADEATACARNLQSLFLSGSSLRAQVNAVLLVQRERRHQVEAAVEALRGGDTDEAAHQLATLLASWEA
jgi:hypothetical protein